MRLFLKNLVFVLLVPCVVAVLLPVFLLGKQGISLEGAGILALAGIIIGGSVLLRCVWDFGRRGRGTPAPIDPPTVLVVSGFYRYVRNPMYIGVLLVIAGEAILLTSWPMVIYAVATAGLFHLFVVLYEEPKLRNTFGATYEEYVRRVPRWIPRFATLNNPKTTGGSYKTTIVEKPLNTED